MAPVPKLYTRSGLQGTSREPQSCGRSVAPSGPVRNDRETSYRFLQDGVAAYAVKGIPRAPIQEVDLTMCTAFSAPPFTHTPV